MNIIKKVYRFYLDGFKNQSKISKRLWLIIIVKLFIMFAVLKIFFFRDYLDSKDLSNKEKSEFIINNLTQHNNEPN